MLHHSNYAGTELPIYHSLSFMIIILCMGCCKNIDWYIGIEKGDVVRYTEKIYCITNTLECHIMYIWSLLIIRKWHSSLEPESNDAWVKMSIS